LRERNGLPEGESEHQLQRLRERAMTTAIDNVGLAAAAFTLAIAGAVSPAAADTPPAASPSHVPGRHPSRAKDPVTPLPRARPPGNPGWRGDIRHFPGHDWHVWRGGRWVHRPHGGRPGWWWVVGPTWYFYPAPMYPYPNPYEPAPAWTVPLPVPSAPPPQFWYFCDESQTDYPYVSTCPDGWKQVPVMQAPAASEPLQ
jgi:hypothetical protein